MQNAAFWTKIAPKYAKSPVGDMAAYDKSLERTRSHLSATDRVLEIGCGTGTTALRLADAVAEITATDFSQGMIDIARAKSDPTGRTGFQVADSTGLPDGAFDTILAFNLFHLVPDLNASIKAVADKLEPGGLFISKTPCLGTKAFFLKPLIWAMRAMGKAPPVSFFRPAWLEEQIRAAGFDIIETGDYPKKLPSHFVVARKR